jgi:hypothetical protein
VHDAGPPLRRLPRTPPRELLSPIGDRGAVGREPDRHLDALGAVDEHDERITEDPEPVVAREHRLTGDLLDPIDPVEPLRSLEDLRCGHGRLRDQGPHA